MTLQRFLFTPGLAWPVVVLAALLAVACVLLAVRSGLSALARVSRAITPFDLGGQPGAVPLRAAPIRR